MFHLNPNIVSNTHPQLTIQTWWPTSPACMHSIDMTAEEGEAVLKVQWAIEWVVECISHPLRWSWESWWRWLPSSLPYTSPHPLLSPHLPSECDVMMMMSLLLSCKFVPRPFLFTTPLYFPLSLSSLYLLSLCFSPSLLSPSHPLSLLMTRVIRQHVYQTLFVRSSYELRQ